MISRRLLLIPVLLVSPAGLALGGPLADSAAEFSGVQGQNNWYYGYWQDDGSYSPGEFQQLPLFASSAWKITASPPPYTSLTSTGGHPNHWGAGGRQWAVRRWLAETTGPMLISGHLAKADAGGGDGIIGAIYIDGALVYSQAIEWNDSVGVNFAVPTCIYANSPVDFVITPRGNNDWNDTTIFTATVDPIPEPATFCLMLLALPFAPRRRR